MTNRRCKAHLLIALALYWIVWLGAAAGFYLGVLPCAMIERAEDVVRAIP